MNLDRRKFLVGGCALTIGAPIPLSGCNSAAGEIILSFIGKSLTIFGNAFVTGAITHFAELMGKDVAEYFYGKAKQYAGILPPEKVQNAGLWATPATAKSLRQGENPGLINISNSHGDVLNAILYLQVIDLKSNAVDNEYNLVRFTIPANSRQGFDLSFVGPQRDGAKKAEVAVREITLGSRKMGLSDVNRNANSLIVL